MGDSKRGFEGAEGIPSVLLTEIANYLKHPSDVRRFRAVCKIWRACFPSHVNLLCFFLPYKISSYWAPFIEISWIPRVRDSLSLVASAVYLIQQRDSAANDDSPPRSWLVTLEEVNAGKLSVRLPLRKAVLTTLSLPENLPRVLSLSGLRVTEIAREYNFRYTNGMHSSADDLVSQPKVILSPDCVLTSNTVDDITAFILYGKGKLALFQLTSQDWEPVCYGRVTYFDDILNFKGMVYSIDRKGRVYVISSNNNAREIIIQIRRITNHIICSGNYYSFDKRKRLVESGGKLYLVVRYSDEDTHKIYFRVYQLNEEERKWEKMTSLGNNILFVSPSVCFFVSAHHCPPWTGNCVVFPPDHSPSYYRDQNHFEGAIDDMLELGVFYLGQSDGAKLMNLYPGYSDLFWPPPAWLQQLASNSDFSN